MASKSFCNGSKFSYIGLNEVELPVSERSEYPRFFVLQDGKIVYKLFTDRNFEGIHIPSKSGEMIEISRGLHLPKTREGGHPLPSKTSDHGTGKSVQKRTSIDASILLCTRFFELHV